MGILLTPCLTCASETAGGKTRYVIVSHPKGNLIYKSPDFAGISDHIGQYCAIVHAIGWLEKQGYVIPVYSQSKTAIAWVKNGECNTDAGQDSELFAKCKKYASETKFPTAFIGWWDYKTWGENPAKTQL